LHKSFFSVCHIKHFFVLYSFALPQKYRVRFVRDYKSDIKRRSIVFARVLFLRRRVFAAQNHFYMPNRQIYYSKKITAADR